MALRICSAAKESLNDNENTFLRVASLGRKSQSQNTNRCHLDFANTIVALRRMAQFSASFQIGLFQTSPRAMEPLPLQHNAGSAKMLTKAAGCQKAANKP